MNAPPDAARPRRPVRRGRVVVALLVVAAAAVGLLPDLLGLDRRAPFAQLVSFRPVLLAGVAVLGIAATVTALVRRRGWTLAVGLMLVTAVGAAWVLPRAIPATDPPEPDAPAGRALTVLSFNPYDGKADVAAVAALVRSANPDLIALPEASGRFTAKLAPLLPGYRFAPSGERRDVENVTAGWRADLGEPTVDVDRTTTTFPSVELTGGGLGDLRFVAFHSVAPKPGDVAGWRDDLATLDRWCANRQIGPAILAGDFNATLDHSVFRDAVTGCADAGERTGEGLVGTWPSWAPRWLGPQIDHVLVTGGIAAETMSVADLPGSDHRAVLTRLRLPA